MELYELTVHEILDKLEKKETNATEITDSYVKRINDKEKEIEAFVSILDKEAMQKAKELNDSKCKKEDGLIKGIPIGIKDNINLIGTRTTCSSKMLENFVSPYNATVINKILDEDMIVLGKMNMDEFAMGSSTEYSAFKKTKNPWNLNTVPGGSSGGSAAGVASNMIPWALGSDTGGSIRQPASFCGVVGLKPTYGLVSRYGLVAFSSSLDQIGPITKDVRDCAILLNIISGHDEKDSTSSTKTKVDYTLSLNKNIKGLRIGIPKEFYGEGINDEVSKSVKEAISVYEKLGAVIQECSLDIAKESLAAYYVLASAEASSNLGRFDGIRYGYRSKESNTLNDIFINSRTEGFGEEVKRRIILGTYVLSSGYYDAYYKKAQKVRNVIKEKVTKLFEKYDILLTPTSPTVAYKFNSRIDNPLEMYLADLCTVSVNIAGVPAISVPCGIDNSGMPIGMQLIGNHFDEETLIKAAYSYEQETNFREKYKPEFKK